MKKIIFVIIVFFLCMPFIQQNLDLFKLKKLVGVSNDAEKPNLTISTWFTGEFQRDFESAIGTQFGFRNLLIRIYNQLDFTLFNLPHASVVVGKNGYLFEDDYLLEISGKSFIGNDSMENKIRNLKIIQQYLSEKNILLFTVLAPGKSYYYSEYLPNRCIIKTTDETNYKSLLKYAHKYDINLIDINDWFLRMKDTSKYPLFPKQGIHWNYYGMALSADSMVKYVEKTKEVNLADVKYSLEHPDNLREETDYDLGNILNLYFKQPFVKMPYPVFNIDNTNKTRPRLLVVADSFYWLIQNSRIFSKIFSNDHYYYYCSTIYTDGRELKESPQDYNLLKEIENFDVVILLQSSANYKNPGVGFVETFTKNMSRLDETSRRILESINSDSLLKSISAEYSARHKMKPEDSDKIIADSLALSELSEIASVKISIKNDSAWSSQLNERAWKNNTSIDIEIEKEAVWFVNLNKTKK